MYVHLPVGEVVVACARAVRYPSVELSSPNFPIDVGLADVDAVAETDVVAETTGGVYTTKSSLNC